MTTKKPQTKTGARAKPAKPVTPANTAASKKTPVTGRAVATAKPKTTIAKKTAAVPAKRAAATRKKPLAPIAKAAAKTEKKTDIKVKKIKQVRDSFTMPETEYAVLGQVKKACLKAGFVIKKSDLLRIGVSLIKQLKTAKLAALLADLTPLKVGRPKNSQPK